MPIDDRTPRLDLEKPAQANTLKNDVARLRDSLDKLDEKVAMLDPATGKIKEDQIADSVARLDATGHLLETQFPASVPVTDKNGHIPVSVIPDEAKTHLFDVSSEVLMLDLKASIGDIARITQPPYSRFILTAADATNRDNWRVLPMHAVDDVNGQTGSVKVAEAGDNTNITALEGLVGPLKLGADGVGPDDAVSLRQINLLMAANQGNSTSGIAQVISGFVGAVEWFNGGRTLLPTSYLPADGQCLDRLKYSTLWAAVNSGMFVSVDDAAWLASNQQRGKYSKGGLAGTCPDKSITGAWFRMPDLNGLQSSSVAALFLRGGNGQTAAIAEVGNIGEVRESGAPNITGSMSPHGAQNARNGGTAIGSVGGAFADTNPQDGYARVTPTMTESKSVGTVDFNASRSNAAYGRAKEVRPNSVSGIWIIRAAGLINTMQDNIASVMTRTSALTPNVVPVEGNRFLSQLKINDDLRATAQFGLALYYNSPVAYNYTAARITAIDNHVNNAGATARTDYNFQADGYFKAAARIALSPKAITMPTNINAQDWAANSSANTAAFSVTFPDSTPGFNVWAPIAFGTVQRSGQIKSKGGAAFGLYMPGTVNSPLLGTAQPCIWGTTDYQANGTPIGADKRWIFITNDYVNSNVAGSPTYKPGTIMTTIGNITGATCDIRTKQNIVDVTGEKSLENIERMQFKEFTYKNDPAQSVHRGMIAQDLEKIDPNYVSYYIGHVDGEEVGDLRSPSSYELLCDALAAIKVLSARVKELEAKLEA